ncbi:TetR/AcrR family transcriptional repressor of mexJK operon [Sphingomonas vulcanisoli]|uniref:TetR/AcrR family transcriptional repressor of mexJK operon n=1 Tax=Sphingomonas vulcanisoli TaxID=1658060 RepID=A0ABX0TQF9_9SPHN|nr:TetR/AcrR family transcriptional regulator [Sphingomonas vulcanisoli]NIJ06627.1 TetR/AcrR family transcriptional repressor of mexJK operon [Sphingomonas vulcanisoli]
MKRPVNLKRAGGRPSDAAKAVAILDAAWSLFLDRGIAATSIELIARRAGVSKVTLYRHYADRAALFEAAVLREMERIEAAQVIGAPMQDADLAGALRAFGIGIMSFLASKPAVDFYAVVAGELRRHPDLASSFYRLGPGRTHANLIALLERAQDSGQLVAIDPATAAEELFGLWQGFSNFRFALGVEIDAFHADLVDRVDRGVALFLRVYAKG